MNRILIFLFILSATFSSVSAMGIQGVVLKDQFFYTPGLERDYDVMFTTNSGFTQSYELYARMLDDNSPLDLTPYVTIDKYYVENVPSASAIPFHVHFKLPDNELSVPGIHEIRVGARETQSLGGGNMGVRTGAEMRIIVIILNSNEYAIVTFNAPNVNENETTHFQFTIINYGKPDILAKGRIEIMPMESDLLLGIARTDDTPIPSMQTKTATAPFTTKGISAGTYRVHANLTWSKTNYTAFNTTFRIGSQYAEVADYTREFVKDAINKMEITIRSKWNNKMTNVYADVNILDTDGNILQTFRSISTDLNPWQGAALIAYFDTNGLPFGNYSARIILNYQGASSTTTGPISITPGATTEIVLPEQPKEKQGLPPYIIILFAVMGILLIILILIVVLLIKKR